jgi:release factor glutamine methyltransferase
MADGGTLTWRALWAETAARLRDAGLVPDAPAARAEARWFCEVASGYAGAEWEEALDLPATVRQVVTLDARVGRRLAGEPTAYALGSWQFRTLDLLLDRRVLIPRPETEWVVEAALERVRRQPGPYLVTDLGTGSGAIALSLAAELPLAGVEVWASDASPDALDVARANLAGLGRRAVNVRLCLGSWWDALPAHLEGRLDLVVSNPPYVAEGDEVEPSVREWEPAAALFAGPDGLRDIRVLVAGAGRWLRPGGWLVVEIGATQGSAVLGLARAASLVDAEIGADLAGRPRYLVARRPDPPSSASAPPN